jgi:hypothetical protein
VKIFIVPKKKENARIMIKTTNLTSNPRTIQC